jgi:hypothetical protein
VFDATAPSSVLVMAELGKPGVALKLHRLAWKITQSDADAENLVEDALMRVLDPEDRPWVPAECTFLTHMRRVMRYLWDQQMHSAVARREVLDEVLSHDDNTRSREPRADDQLERHRSLAVYRQLGKQLREEIADDPLAVEIFDKGAGDVPLEPGALAKVLPNPPDEIRRAIKRIRYRAEKIIDEYNASEDLRMKALYETHATKKDEALP